MTYTIPSDAHSVGDSGHTTDHNNIADCVTNVYTGHPDAVSGKAWQYLAGGHDKLTQWYAGLAGRAYSGASVMALGDSSCYQNATLWGRDWPSLLTATLNVHYPSAGLATHGRGWLPVVLPGQPTPSTAFASGIGNVNYLAMTGTPTAHGPVGVNLDAWDFSAGGGCTAVYSLVGTTAYIVYVTQSGGGSFKWKLDSGSFTTVSTSSGSTVDGAFVTVALGGGAHTLTIEWASGGATWIEGVVEYNGDEAAGLVSFNGGSSGATSGQWAALFSNGSVSNPGGALAEFEPSVVLLSMGADDYNTSVPAATMQANIEAVITGFNAAVTTLGAAPKPSYVLVAPPNLGTGWAAYQAAYYAVAAANSAVDVVDMSLRFPALGASSTYGLYTSGEWSNLGHAMAADILAAFLGPQ